MCTVSWVQQPAGYHLLSNRDEKRTRGVAFAPRVGRRAGVRYLAPMDADYGGTWLAVNEWGLSICLLNGTAAAPESRAAQSRGLLIPELIWARSVDDAGFLLRQCDLSSFAPFTVVLLEPSAPATVARWNGERLSLDPTADHRMPLISSSYDTEGVRAARAARFAEMVEAAGTVDPALLYRFHSSHGPVPDAYSPCMHRDDAQTVSFSWVVVTATEIRFLYLPAAPCESSIGEQAILERAA